MLVLIGRFCLRLDLSILQVVIRRFKVLQYIADNYRDSLLKIEEIHHFATTSSKYKEVVEFFKQPDHYKDHQYQRQSYKFSPTSIPSIDQRQRTVQLSEHTRGRQISQRRVGDNREKDMYKCLDCNSYHVDGRSDCYCVLTRYKPRKSTFRGPNYDDEEDLVGKQRPRDGEDSRRDAKEEIDGKIRKTSSLASLKLRFKTKVHSDEKKGRYELSKWMTESEFKMLFGSYKQLDDEAMVFWRRSNTYARVSNMEESGEAEVGRDPDDPDGAVTPERKSVLSPEESVKVNESGSYGNTTHDIHDKSNYKTDDMTLESTLFDMEKPLNEMALLQDLYDETVESVDGFATAAGDTLNFTAVNASNAECCDRRTSTAERNPIVSPAFSGSPLTHASMSFGGLSMLANVGSDPNLSCDNTVRESDVSTLASESIQTIREEDYSQSTGQLNTPKGNATLVPGRTIICALTSAVSTRTVTSPPYVPSDGNDGSAIDHCERDLDGCMLNEMKLVSRAKAKLCHAAYERRSSDNAILPNTSGSSVTPVKTNKQSPWVAAICQIYEPQQQTLGENTHVNRSAVKPLPKFRLASLPAGSGSALNPVTNTSN